MFNCSWCALHRRSRPHVRACFAALFGLSVTLCHTDVSAQSGVVSELTPTIVTAARSPLLPVDVIPDVVVVTREDIERQGIGDVSDLLRSTGAVQFARTGGPGQPASLYIRGAETRHTLVLIDGVRIDSQATGGAPWESIPTTDIERIEIVRGPASAMYGSDAIGGVVQIFTRKGTGPASFDVGAATGSLHTARVDGGVRGTVGVFDYALAAATEHSDGIVLIPNGNDPNYNPAPAGYQKHNWSARLGAQLGAADRVEFLSLSSHLDAEFNDYSTTALAHGIDDATAEKLSWTRQWSAAVTTQLAFGESRERYDDATDVYLSETRVRSYSLDGSYRLTPQQQLLVVAERTEDFLTDSSLAATGTGSGRRSENGLGLGYLAKYGATDVQANVRRDQDSEFGAANTGSLGLGYALSSGLRIVGSAGTSFRAPTIYQNTSVYGPFSLPGGASLLPETGHNIEAGLRYSGDHSEGSVTAYRNLVDNLINFGPPGGCLSSYGCYANVQQARLQGVSLAGAWRSGPVHLSATLDLQAPKDLATGNLLPRRSREFGTVRAQTQWQGWALGTGVEFAGRRYEDAANTEPLGGYALLNFDAGYGLSRDLKLQLNLDNALNRVYQTALGYAQLPRTVMVGLRYATAP